jgi:hypothetical protein
VIDQTVLQRWRELADKATHGPWRWDDHRDGIVQVVQDPYPSTGTVVGAGTVGYENASLCISEDDAAFIVEARTAVPKLLDEIERVEAECAAWRESHANLLAELFETRAALRIAEAIRDDARAHSQRLLDEKRGT